MDAIKAQIARMQEQLGALSASQKMLAASLLAIMVLTLMFWSRYAGTAEMEPVLEQSLSSDETGRIQMELGRLGIQFKVVNSLVMVPADRKLEALAALSYAQAVPQNTRGAYDEIIKRINPWSSQSDNDATRNDAKAQLLGQIIRRFPGVASADVLIDPTNERRIGGGGRQPRASVLITTRETRGPRADRSLARAAASTVAGAQSGLDLSEIRVAVNGAHHNLEDADSMGIGNADEMLARQQEAEQFITQKVTKQLDWMGAVLVTVTVDVNNKSESRSEELYDPKNVAQKELSTETETTEETAAAPAPVGEPGAKPNSAMEVSPPISGSSGAGGSIRDRNSTKFENHFGKTTVDSRTPAGKTKVVTAAVRVPRSHFVNLYRLLPGNQTKDPDEVSLAPLYASELPKIRNEVKKCINIENDDDVSVEWYPDALPMMAAATTVVASQAGASSSMSALLLGHYKEVVLGVLALVSLFMVSSIIKKGAPAPAIATAIELKEAPALSNGEDMAGEVGEGGGELAGMELDDDTIKAQQMVEQVSTMVKENPDGAANLVQRWLNRS